MACVDVLSARTPGYTKKTLVYNVFTVSTLKVMDSSNGYYTFEK